MASSSNYSLLISSKFSIRLSPMTHSRRQHPVVLKENGGFLGFSGLKEQKGLGCSIHVLQRNPSFGSIQRRCNKGWRSEMGKEKSVEEDDAGINGSTEKLGSSSMSAEIGNDVAKDNIDGQNIPKETGEDKTSTAYWWRGFVNSNKRELYKNLKLLNPEFQPPRENIDGQNIPKETRENIDGQNIPKETGEDKTSTEYWWRGFVNSNKRELYTNLKLLNPEFQPPRENTSTEPFFYNEAEMRYYYFVKELVTRVKESLKSVMKALMVIPLCFIIVAFALKIKVDMVMKNVFHDDKVSSQEDSDEEHISAI